MTDRSSHLPKKSGEAFRAPLGLLRAPKLGRGILFAALVGWFVLWGFAGRLLKAETENRLITSTLELNAVQGKDRELPQPVRLEFIATFIDVNWHNLWLEEKGNTSYLLLSENPPPIEAGQTLRLEGTVVPNQGLEAGRLKLTVLRATDPRPWEDISGRVGDMYSLNQHRVKVRAFVDTVQYVKPRHVRLSLIAENRELIGWILLQPDELLPALGNQFVEIEALYSSRTDPTGTRPEIELWAQSTAKVKVLYPISNDPDFALPATPLNSLLKLPLHTKVKVRGRVQSQQPGRNIVVRDETGQVTVETIQEQRLPPGTEVEALGEFVVQASACTIRSGLFRRVANRENPSGRTPNEGTITMVEDVRKLSGEEAGLGRHVDVSGVVTWDQSDLPYLFVQDVSGGIRVYFAPGSLRLPIIGKSVRIEGHTRMAGPFPAIELEKLTELNSMRFPLPHPVTFDQAMTGGEDGQWVEMQGVLSHSEVREDNRTHLDITTPSGSFQAVIWTPEDLESMANALIRIRGICDNDFDDNGRIKSIRLWVPYVHNISLDEPPPSDAFDCPLRSIPSLRRMSTFSGIMRTRVQGKVLAYHSGTSLYLQEQDAGMLVLSASTIPVVPGDLVEAVGLVGREGRRTLLRDAVFRKVGHTELPEPIDIDNKSVPSESLDGRLVRVRGTVINELRRPEFLRFTLQRGDSFFEAWLDGAGEAPALEYPLNTELELVGIYRSMADDAGQTRGFRLELRGPGDVRVIRHARFWTLDRALGIAAILGGCAVLVLAWAATLRRRVKQQMAQIRAQLQKELALEDRHRGLVENASDFIFTADLEGRITSFNAAGERLTGFERSQALTLSLRDLLVPEQDKSVWENPVQALDGDVAVTLQSRLRTRTDRVVWVETSMRLIREGGRAVGVLGIVRDISKRKEIEDELKRARDAAEANTKAKSEFLANMSHEIRTPMNAVIGMSNLLLDTALDERQRDFAETIRNGAEALLTVLNDILDFSKMEAGHLRMETVDFDLRDTVDGAVELMAARAVAKRLELTAFVPSKIPCAVRGDPSRLRQVLLNLLGNAVKFTERGEVSLCVLVDAEDAAGVSLRFEVSDTGVGISDEEQTRLFRPFSQADGSTTRRFGGTGLGLAISKQLVELFGGECGVRSRLGQGSTFWFTARFAKQNRSAGGASIITTARLRRLEALFVEDCDASIRALEDYAGSWGMQTASAKTGGDALQRLLRAVSVNRPFAVVIVDSVLPDMSGVELVRAIRKSDQLKGLPVVMINSLDRTVSPDEIRALAIGSSFFKPVRLGDMMAALLQAFAMEAAPGREQGRRPLFGTGTASPALPSTSRSANPVEATSGLRVLLAEDNPVNQKVALLQLQKLGHKVKAVGNGREVLQALDGETFDVILMDCQMPEMDGFEATRCIRKRDTQAGIRIIALTANAMQGDRDRCLDAGMDDYLSKPLRVAELRAALARNRPATS